MGLGDKEPSELWSPVMSHHLIWWRGKFWSDLHSNLHCVTSQKTTNLNTPMHTHIHVHTHTQTRAHAHSFESHNEALVSMFYTFNLYVVQQGLVVFKKRGQKSKIFR